MNTDPAVIISGFATLDYVLTTAAPLTGTGTVLAEALTQDAWPRPGGATLYAATPLARAGFCAMPLVAVGDDDHGRAYIEACVAAGVSTKGVAVAPDGKTPVCLLIYHDAGGYSCLLDTGRTPAKPTAAQLACVATAQAVIISAAQPEWTAGVLSVLRPDQKLAVISKGDPACFPPELLKLLGQRADYLFCNESERSLIPEPPAAQILIETRGAGGVFVRSGAHEFTVPVAPLKIRDATGAGDTLAGEVIAHLLMGVAPEGAVKKGIEAAAALLNQRRL